MQYAAAQCSWIGNDGEIDIADFLRQRSDEIASTYSSAVDDNQLIKYFFRLEVEFSRDVSDNDDTTTVQRTTGLFATPLSLLRQTQQSTSIPVSYTHLTLPTNREV